MITIVRAIVLVAAFAATFSLLPPTDSFAQTGASSSKSTKAKTHKGRSGDRFRSPARQPLPQNRASRDAGRPASNSCAEFGAGFVRVEGTNTCMRIGGSIAVGTSGNSGSQFRGTR